MLLLRPRHHQGYRPATFGLYEEAGREPLSPVILDFGLQKAHHSRKTVCLINRADAQRMTYSSDTAPLSQVS